MSRRFKVVSMHFTRECNLSCPFCYRKKDNRPTEKPREFFIDLVKYASQIAPQIALGGGEPLIDPRFVMDMGKECKKYGIMLNITTNGLELLGMDFQRIVEIFKNVTMVSVSLDDYKWEDISFYNCAVKNLKQLTGLKIGTNLLVNKHILESGGKNFYRIVSWLIKEVGVDSVYALYPKNLPLGIDMDACKEMYQILSTIYRGKFFVDDLTKEIIEQGYDSWKKPCHHGKDLISIDETGGVSGCSFDDEPAFIINEPSELLRASSFVFDERMECPYLIK